MTGSPAEAQGNVRSASDGGEAGRERTRQDEHRAKKYKGNQIDDIPGQEACEHIYKTGTQTCVGRILWTCSGKAQCPHYLKTPLSHRAMQTLQPEIILPRRRERCC
eukprot:765915-Hanusia_phi.AAC.2